MGALPGGLHAGLRQSTLHDFANRNCTAEAADRGTAADEQASASASRPVAVKITGKGSCDIRWQWKLCPFSLSTDRDQSAFPINVFEIESDDFTCSQTETSE
jgi:hypothetical protein